MLLYPDAPNLICRMKKHIVESNIFDGKDGVRFLWVSAHAGVGGNERADAIAK